MQQEEQFRQVTQCQDRSMIPEPNQFDYSKCNFECRIYKKKMISSQLKYCYINDNYVAICNEPYKKQPDSIIGLTHDVKVQWIYNKTTQPYKLAGFIFKQVSEEIEYVADEEVLKNLKSVFRKKIFQSRFQDEYEVIAQVGKGNYARVYSIKHRVTGMKYAVKCFEKKKLQQIDRGILSLYNELKIMRTLSEHQNVIKLYETFEGENTYYFVMEIVEGASLYDEMKKHAQKSYTDMEILNIMRMLVEAIGYCSKHNIMHRDLKPENILFAQRGNFSELKIVDFGLATFANEYPYIFPKCGTPGFVAPEIANLIDKTQAYDVVCDIFSIGVIFHILLTGEAVFPGKKFNEVLKKNKACEISLEGQMYDFVSKEAKDLMYRMLQKDPKQRITADEALKHPYFTLQNNKIGGRAVHQKYGASNSSAGNLDEQETIDEIPQVRPKKTSLFTKPPRLPYFKKEDAVDPKHEDLNSFVTKEPIWAGEKQNEYKLQQMSQQIPQLPDSLYYTIGSLDQTNKQQMLMQNNNDKLENEPKVPMPKAIRKNSSQNEQNFRSQQQEPIKESIKEDEDEIEMEEDEEKKLDNQQ